MENLQRLLPQKLVTRIAPTPSGLIHMGNALNFIITASIARMASGTLHLRIDDFDSQRVRTESVEDILWSLDYLGIKIDHGPSTVKEWQNNFVQKKYEARYFEDILKLSGPKAYYCLCSRAEIFQQNPLGHYQGKCRGNLIDPSVPTGSWRFEFTEKNSAKILDIEQGAIALPWSQLSGDIQLRRGDGVIAYHPLSILEDRRLGVNLIVRGPDLLNSSLIQQTLMEKWGWGSHQLPIYFHHGAMTSGGKKLSKTEGSLGIRHLAGQGHTAASLYQNLASLFQFSHSSKVVSIDNWSSELALQPSWSFLTQTVDLALGP